MRSCYLVRKPRGMAALWGFNRKQMMLSLPLGCPRFLPREDREKRGPGEGSRELCRSHSRGITLMCHFRHNLAPAAQTSPPPVTPSLSHGQSMRVGDGPSGDTQHAHKYDT